jgi:hypothetical protein
MPQKLENSCIILRNNTKCINHKANHREINVSILNKKLLFGRQIILKILSASNRKFMVVQHIKICIFLYVKIKAIFLSPGVSHWTSHQPDVSIRKLHLHFIEMHPNILNSPKLGMLQRHICCRFSEKLHEFLISSMSAAFSAHHLPLQ